jgi:hypothetical protein
MGISLDLPTESPYHRIPLISGYPEERTKKWRATKYKTWVLFREYFINIWILKERIRTSTTTTKILQWIKLTMIIYTYIHD